MAQDPARFILSSVLIMNYLALFLFLAGCHAADIYSRFYVSQGQGPITRSGNGNYGGCCYGIDADVNALYLEAIDMAEVALAALNRYASDTTIQATVKSFSGIHPNKSNLDVLAAHADNFKTVKGGLKNTLILLCLMLIAGSRIDRYNGVLDFAAKYRLGTEPGFFCDDSWRWKMEYLYRGGELILTSLDEEYPDSHTEYSYSPLYKRYIKGAAYLANFRAEVKDRTVVDTNGVLQMAYFPELVILLAQTSGAEEAIINADSYTWFAHAMYLDSCDWSRGFCADAADAADAEAAGTAAITARSNRTSIYKSHGHGHLKHRRYPLDGVVDASSI
ncbi:hypothetical protein BDV12DRAFT_204059 [Aspergillus spectabilis]